MTPEQTGTLVGTWIGIGAIIALVIWAIWALIKYKPFGVLVKMMYDLRKVVIEIIKMYGNGPSFFSLKRFNIGLVTFWALAMASWFIFNKKDLTAIDLMLIITPILTKSVYEVYQSQQDKKMNLNSNLANKVTDNVTDLANKTLDNDQK